MLGKYQYTGLFTVRDGCNNVKLGNTIINEELKTGPIYFSLQEDCGDQQDRLRISFCVAEKGNEEYNDVAIHHTDGKKLGANKVLSRQDMKDFLDNLTKSCKLKKLD